MLGVAITMLLCLSVASVTVSADLCTSRGGACVDICNPGNGGACADGGLYSGLCSGPSPTLRCCLVGTSTTVTTISTTTTVPPSPNCLQCICQASGCIMGCVGNVCGPYRISWAYWTDCGKPGGSYWACHSDMACSRQCVFDYMKRYVPQNQNCERYARVHKGGPWGWQSWAATTFWKLVSTCCATTLGGC